jgi:hypothetical protein
VEIGDVKREELARQTSEYREQGDVEERDNPEYVERKAAGLDTAGHPPKVQVQKVVVHEIVTVTTRYSAEGRTRFSIAHQQQEVPAEITARVVRESVQEELNPAAERVIWERNPGRRRALRELRRDPVPDSGSLKSRLQSVLSEASAARLANAAARYPVELAKVARRFQQLQQWELATNYWGYCLAALADVDTSGHYAGGKLSEEDVASATRHEYEAQQVLCAELRQLKEAAARESREAVVRLVQGQR